TSRRRSDIFMVVSEQEAEPPLTQSYFLISTNFVFCFTSVRTESVRNPSVVTLNSSGGTLNESKRSLSTGDLRLQSPPSLVDIITISSDDTESPQNSPSA